MFGSRVVGRAVGDNVGDSDLSHGNAIPGYRSGRHSEGACDEVGPEVGVTVGVVLGARDGLALGDSEGFNEGLMRF